MSFNLERDGISQSTLAEWLTCRQKAKYRMDGWVSIRPVYPLRFGSLMHEALERLHDWQSTHRLAIPPRKFCLDTVFKVADQYQKEHGDRWGAEENQEHERMAVVIAATLPPYFRFWEKKPIPWMDVESSFRVKFSGTWLKGKFDGVFKRGKNLWLYDAKSSSRIDEEQLGEVLTRDFQINFYMLALRLITRTYPSGFLYDIIRKTSLSLGKSEGLDAYQKRIEKHIDQDPEHYFKRYEVSIIRSDLENFQRQLQEILSEFQTWTIKGRPCWTYGQPCAGKYGSCNYAPLCIDGNQTMFFRKKKTFGDPED